MQCRDSTTHNGVERPAARPIPDVIVQALDTEDVIAALRYARAKGYQVGVRSGGHSWAASHLRDGGMLLDVSRLGHCIVDSNTMTAEVGPGKNASVLATELDSRGCSFRRTIVRGYAWVATFCRADTA